MLISNALLLPRFSVTDFLKQCVGFGVAENGFGSGIPIEGSPNRSGNYAEVSGRDGPVAGFGGRDAGFSGSNPFEKIPMVIVGAVELLRAALE